MRCSPLNWALVGFI
ncbi:putative membrane protein, partial [Vibrio parahaemolyticus VPTS-2010_2]